MGYHRTPSAIVVAGFVAALCVLALTAAPAPAQQGAPPGLPPPGSRDPTAEARERQQREARLRSAEMVGGKARTDQRAVEAAVGQMREDFKRIQVLRNELARHLLAGKPLDYEFIADEAAEINRRASRLRTHLVRDTPADEEKERKKPPEIADALMKDALVTLCVRIDSFTENPMFKAPDVVNIEQSAKAGGDLQTIIQLSDAVRKTAERLNKAAPRK
jgi:hypothetical protein